MSIAPRTGAAFGLLENSKQTSAPVTTPSSAVATDAKIANPGTGIAPDQATTYVYDYTGATFTLPTIPVLKRDPGFSTSQLSSLLQGVNVDLLSLGALTNAHVQQFSVSEDKTNGYTVNVDANDGSVSMYQTTSTGGIIPMKALAIPSTNTAATNAPATLPSDAELIQVANAFLTTYGISHADYGTPVVDTSFFPYGVLTANTKFPAPPTVTVTYPLVVNNTPVVSEPGYAVGLSVSIDTATQQVMGVNNLRTLNYESSQYALTEDVQKVLDVAKQGGMYGISTPAIAPLTTNVKTNTVHIQLGTPTVGYISSYYQLDATSAEYLVPAMVFPIMNVPSGTQLYRNAVVVPLVQELSSPTTVSQPAGSTASGSATSAAPSAQ